MTVFDNIISLYKAIKKNPHKRDSVNSGLVKQQTVMGVLFLSYMYVHKEIAYSSFPSHLTIYLQLHRSHSVE